MNLFHFAFIYFWLESTILRDVSSSREYSVKLRPVIVDMKKGMGNTRKEIKRATWGWLTDKALAEAVTVGLESWTSRDEEHNDLYDDEVNMQGVPIRWLEPSFHCCTGTAPPNQPANLVWPKKNGSSTTPLAQEDLEPEFEEAPSTPAARPRTTPTIPLQCYLTPAKASNLPPFGNYTMTCYFGKKGYQCTTKQLSHDSGGCPSVQLVCPVCNSQLKVTVMVTGVHEGGNAYTCLDGQVSKGKRVNVSLPFEQSPIVFNVPYNLVETLIKQENH